VKVEKWAKNGQMVQNCYPLSPGRFVKLKKVAKNGLEGQNCYPLSSSGDSRARGTGRGARGTEKKPQGGTDSYDTLVNNTVKLSEAM